MPSSSPLRPSLRRRLRTLAALVAVAAAPPLGAQPLPGSQPSDAPGTFAQLVRRGVDSTLARWAKSAEARDAATLSRLYAATAAIYPTYGDPIHGRQAIGDALAQALPRMAHARFAVERVDASGDLASVIAELTYDVSLASGGTYERHERMHLTLAPVWNAGWTIQTQLGGDLAPRVAWVTPPRTTLAAGQSDTLAVRITDALGGGVRDVLVAFEVAGEGASVSPGAVRTNARGEAVAVRTLSAGATGGELRVTTAIAPEDALLSAFHTTTAAATGTP